MRKRIEKEDLNFERRESTRQRKDELSRELGREVKPRKTYGPRDENPEFQGERKPYSSDSRGERKDFNSGERKPYGERSERKPFDGERKPYGERSERKSFDGERKPYGERSERKSFDGERKPYGERSERKSFDGERKPYGERSERKPFDGERSERRPFDGERKPYGERSERRPFDGERKPYGERSERKPFDGERKPYGERSERRPFDGERKPYGERSERRNFDGERKPYGERSERRPFDGERKPYGERSERRNFDGERSERRPFDGERKPYGERSERRSFDGERSERKPFDGERKPYGEKRDFDSREKKPYGDKPERKYEKKERTTGSSKGNFGGDKLYKAHKPSEESDKWTPNYKLDKYKETAPKAVQRKMAVSEKKNTNEIRLNRYIANAGICSRREADDLIKAGEIKVNGNIITEMGYQVKPGDIVKYGNRKLNREKMVYVLVNKPKDFITTTEDPEERKTVMDLVKNACEERIYPVGRLDRNTTGLLLLTNDGELADKLTHPSYEVEKIYQVEIDKPLTTEHFDQILKGITLEDGEIKADELAIVTPDAMVVGIKIHSGRNRIVRRVFESLGYEVLKLDRTTFAGLTKKDLPRGSWRFLNEKEVVKLKFFK
jgi:23S rRNA pseudouridine2605 synthase